MGGRLIARGDGAAFMGGADFTWKVPTAGFVWVEDGHGDFGGRRLVARPGGENKETGPLREYPALCCSFADLRTLASFRAFASEHGRLSLDIDGEPAGDHEVLWHRETSAMRALLAVYDALRKRDVAELRQWFVRRDPRGWCVTGGMTITGPEVRGDLWERVRNIQGGNDRGLFTIGWLFIELLLNRRYRDAPLLVSGTAYSSLDLAVHPRTLLDALWLQAGQLIARQQELRRCRQCGAWFLYGHGAKRIDARFCSVSCRVGANRRKRRAVLLDQASSFVSPLGEQMEEPSENEIIAGVKRDIRAGRSVDDVLRSIRRWCTGSPTTVFLTDSWMLPREKELRRLLEHRVTEDQATALQEFVLRLENLDVVIGWLGGTPPITWAHFHAVRERHAQAQADRAVRLYLRRHYLLIRRKLWELPDTFAERFQPPEPTRRDRDDFVLDTPPLVGGGAPRFMFWRTDDRSKTRGRAVFGEGPAACPKCNRRRTKLSHEYGELVSAITGRSYTRGRVALCDRCRAVVDVRFNRWNPVEALRERTYGDARARYGKVAIESDLVVSATRANTSPAS